MSKPLLVPLPADLELDDTYVIRVTALDPTTGDVVSGVNVADVTLIVDDLAGAAGGSLASDTFAPVLIRNVRGA